MHRNIHTLWDLLSLPISISYSKLITLRFNLYSPLYSEFCADVAASNFLRIRISR